MIKGKNPTLLKVSYVKPDSKTARKEVFQVLYNDDEGNVYYAEEPAEADIYIVKPEYRTYDLQKPEERIDHCDKVRVPISQIRYRIAKEAGDWGKSIIQQATDRHDFKLLNQLYKWPYAYGCDFQPEFYFMHDWYQKYELKMPHLSKAFMDIEIDMIDYTVDMDRVENSAYAPVNAITIILEDTDEAWTFILKPYIPPTLGRDDEEYNARYDKYRMQLNDHEYLMTHLDEFYQDLHESFDETYGYINYHVREYEQEIELIADAFRLINTRKPNFCEIWNSSFDCAYLVARIEALGYDPKSIICHPDIPYPVCAFKQDRSTYILAKQTPVFYVTSYTQYICQMRVNIIMPA